MTDLSAPRPTVVCSDERTAEADGPTIEVDRWRRLAEHALCSLDARGELTLTFVDRDDIAELNAEHLGGSGPTDVLSFPLDAPESPASPEEIPVLLGDIVISPDVARAQYADHAGSFADEIALLVVHGVLHIVGHDHAEPDDAIRMQALEVELLETHHWSGPAPAGFRQDHPD